MSGRCEECGEVTIWDQELGSAICAHCGTLADPTQSVLTSHLEPSDNSTRDLFWNSAQGSTLKGRNGWALAGQGKEARDRKNTIAMHEFIQTIAIRLSSPGSTSRAKGIFDQVMRRGQYRWGRRAKLAAGAAIAIALRESHKSDALLDIAYLLDEPLISLSRAFTSVVSLLQLSLTSADPTAHLPILQTHLVSLIKEPSSPLPVKLIATLAPLVPRLPVIVRTANSLSALLSRNNTLSHLPTPPTACALLMLSLEAELLSSLPNAGVLAQALSTRFGAGKGVVMQRYKLVYDLIEEWIREVPWLDGHQRKKGGGGRSKVAKRVVVAKGLKDVVQFQEEIWRKKLTADARPRLEFDADGEEEDHDEDSLDSLRGESTSESGMSTEISLSKATGDVTSGFRNKKRKTVHERTITRASDFLLNPASCGLSSVSSWPEHEMDTAPDLLTHLLTADTSNLSHVFSHAPTRLQLLAASRGGADEKDILDDDLFAEGELESFMRSTEEVDILRTAMAWDPEVDPLIDVPHSNTRGKKRARGELEEGTETQGSNNEKVKEKGTGSKKINMDVFAKLLDPSFNIDEEDAPSSDEKDAFVGPIPSSFSNGEEIVEEWRPLSPGGNGFDEDRYDV